MRGREGAGAKVASRQSGTRRNQNPHVSMSPLRIQAPLLRSPLAGHLLSLLLVPAHLSCVQLLGGQVEVGGALRPPRRLGGLPLPPRPGFRDPPKCRRSDQWDPLTTRTEEQQRTGGGPCPPLEVWPERGGWPSVRQGGTQTRERAVTPGNFLGFASSRVPPGTNLVPPRGLKQRLFVGGSRQGGASPHSGLSPCRTGSSRAARALVVQWEGTTKGRGPPGASLAPQPKAAPPLF